MTARPWEVEGTREIPEWEREALERLGHLIQPRPADMPEPTFGKAQDD